MKGIQNTVQKSILQHWTLTDHTCVHCKSNYWVKNRINWPTSCAATC